MEQSDRRLKELIIGEVRRVLVEARTAGGVQKDAAQGRKPEEPWEGRSLTNFDWDYFIPNTSPTFEFEFRMKYRKIFAAEVAFLDFRTRLFPGILAFGALVLESFQIEGIRKDFFEISAGALL